MKLTNLPRLRTLSAFVAFSFVIGFSHFATAKDTDEKVSGFLQQVEDSGALNNEQKTNIRSAVEKVANDEFSKDQAISSGLLVMYPEYEEAVLLADDDLDSAAEKLGAMVKGDDKYLAADAAFYLARSLMGVQRHEDALDLLGQLTGDLSEFTLHTGNALYFTAVAQANLLQNKQSIETFNRFLEENPNAPERLRVSAWRQLEMLAAIEEGSLSDVFQRMDFSRRRLELEKTGDLTQEQQDEVVKMLQKLIKEQEKKECSSCSSSKNCENEGEQPKDGQAQNKGQGKSNKGGTSNQENGVVRRTYDNGPASPWSRLRDRSRDPANTAVKEKLPARYRQVVEEYYKSLNDSDGSNNND